MNPDDWTPVGFENCHTVSGPFYHGTKSVLQVGDLLVPGFPSNFEAGRISNHLYFSAGLDAAAWGAELAVALVGQAGRGFVYVVEPTGLFEDDPNVTNKRFPGNPTRSYRTRQPLRVVGVVEDWLGHSPEAIRGMVVGLERLKQGGRAVIED